MNYFEKYYYLGSIIKIMEVTHFANLIIFTTTFFKYYFIKISYLNYLTFWAIDF